MYTFQTIEEFLSRPFGNEEKNYFILYLSNSLY